MGSEMCIRDRVAYGKRVATKEDYFRIAFHKALVDSLNEWEKDKKTRRHK